MTLSSNDYLAFLLRLWREQEDMPWRASLQNPHTGEQHHFSDLSLLINFLEEQTGVSLFELPPDTNPPDSK